MYIIYILKSLKDTTKCYIGLTQNLEKRLNEHNRDKCNYTKKYSPWEIETYITFRNKDLATSFEKYLKAGSGHAFLKKRFLQ
ncbi:hypothetical protein MNBD_UNCLBAC01-1300 [hydrothermal vent metagenome]|uniref:GIY-YIG domain-containing protein n=1 Tax=hydrothermal vent metagenome TaxID=652676 RepID=A0A3B1D1M3_9ZZZZ